MAAICARSKQYIYIILNKIEGASRVRYMPLVFQVLPIQLCGQRVVLHFIVGEIQDGRHLTR